MVFGVGWAPKFVTDPGSIRLLWGPAYKNYICITRQSYGNTLVVRFETIKHDVKFTSYVQ
jgi:hypothetical protein